MSYDAEFKVDIQFGAVELRTWFELQPDGSSIGMGQAIHRDEHGNITKVVTEPTGVHLEMR